MEEHSRFASEEYHALLNSGELFVATDPELMRYQRTLVERIDAYNATPENDEGYATRESILRQCMGTYGEGLCIFPPLHANWGLAHVHVGKNVFMNYNAVLVDDGDIFIGDDVMFGPNVTIVTAEHPLSPELRRKGYQYNKPVHIGNNVWIGADATVLAGVTIGDNSVIGAGAVVTRDVEPNSVAVGVPARVVKKIDTEQR